MAPLPRALLKSDVVTNLACHSQAHGGRNAHGAREAREPTTPAMHFHGSGRRGRFPDRDIQNILTDVLACLSPTPPPAWALAALSPV